MRFCLQKINQNCLKLFDYEGMIRKKKHSIIETLIILATRQRHSRGTVCRSHEEAS